MAVAKDELEGLLGHRDIAAARVPVLLYANKMDLPSALEPPDIMALLGLQVGGRVGRCCLLLEQQDVAPLPRAVHRGQAVAHPGVQRTLRRRRGRRHHVARRPAVQAAAAAAARC